MKKLSTAQIKALRLVEEDKVTLNDWGNGLGLINWTGGVHRRTGEKLLKDGYIFAQRTLVEFDMGGHNRGYWSDKRLQIKLTEKGQTLLDAIDSVINCKACDSQADDNLNWDEVEAALDIRNYKGE